MSASTPIHILLATLGGQPQVVTFTLDLLLARGIPIREVIVVHPASYDGLQSSITRLQSEFDGDRYQKTGQPMRFRRRALAYYNNPIHDIVDEQSADYALTAMNDLIYEQKEQRRIVHFSISGGRRLMGYLSFSAALLNFGPADRLWHIHTPQEFQQQARNGEIMHAQPDDGIRLIEVPFARLAQPILTRILSSNPHNARTIIEEQEAHNEEESRKQIRRFLGRLSPTEQKVLRAFAQGLNPQEVAEQFDRQLSTISTHTHKIYREYRNLWSIPEEKRVDYRDLRNTFAAYFSKDE